ncbi:uncharacterized protein TNCV_377151 [Trichonephila clavipes]|nr:uncharacterized protein TNCV_377151 [Trichonephila clavipes]
MARSHSSECLLAFLGRHQISKRPTPEPKQGIKRAIPSSVSSRNHKYRRPNNPSQGSQPIAGPSHQQDSRQDKSPTVASRHAGSGQYNKARETKTTKDGTNKAAERRIVRSKQTTAVRPCPYYLRSRVKQPEGFPEERRNSGLASIPQNNIRRRSLKVGTIDANSACVEVGTISTKHLRRGVLLIITRTIITCEEVKSVESTFFFNYWIHRS